MHRSEKRIVLLKPIADWEVNRPVGKVLPNVLRDRGTQHVVSDFKKVLTAHAAISTTNSGAV